MAEETKTFAEQLKEITESERQWDYGHPLINFLRIAIRWNVYLANRGITLTPLDVAMMMIDTKMARLQNTYKYDSVLDIAGYASCIARMDEKMREHGHYGGIKDVEAMGQHEMISLLQDLEGDEDD